MLHAFHHHKSKPNSTPDEIYSDFRRVLRQRANNHRQFYRRLSATPVLSSLRERPTSGCRHSPNPCNRDTADNVCFSENEFFTMEASAVNQLKSCENTTIQSTKPCLLPLNSAPNSVSGKLIVNQRPSAAADDQIEFINKNHHRFGDKRIDSPVTSREEESANWATANSQSAKSTLGIDGINENDTPTYGQRSVKSLSPLTNVSVSTDTADTTDGNDSAVKSVCAEDIISVSTRADGGAFEAACNHFADNDSSVSLLSLTTTPELPPSSSTSSQSTAVVVAPTAINNNKTCGQLDRNHSNYLTFVEAKSPDRSSESGAAFYQQSRIGDRSDRCCRQSRCCTENSQGFGWSEKDSSSCLDFGATSSTQKDKTCTIKEGFSEFSVRSSGPRACVHNNSRTSGRPFANFPINEGEETSFIRLEDIGALLSRDTPVNGIPVDLTDPSQFHQYYHFPCVDKLVKMYTKLVQDKKSDTKQAGVAGEDKSKAMEVNCESSRSSEATLIEGLQIKNERAVDMSRSSPVSDEGCALASSPYSSDLEDNENDPERRKEKEKVMRSSSSDSALDLDEEPPMEPPANMNTGRRLTLTVTDIPLRAALLPVAEPKSLPDSTMSIEQNASPSANQTSVPSKVLLEERLVEIPEDKFATVPSSRRESAQSTLSDFNPIESGAVRYVRTPSVVVSDYSDDVLCGVTLEEIEYFRAHRMRRRRSSADTNHERDDAASDVSAASSCSNLDYCGSTISGLDGNEYYVNGERMSIDRKISGCSTCSTVSGDDEDESGYIIQEQDYVGDDQQQQKEDMLRLQQKEQRRKINTKARHPKFIN